MSGSEARSAVDCMHAAVGHAGCQHFNYDMDCDEFGALIIRAGSRCEVCRTLPEDTGHRQLHIDHDPKRGPWAVRGLVCSPCNVRLDRWPIPPTPAEAAFVANPWVDEYHGSRVERGSEPPIGTTVACGNSRRLWTRADVGWWPAAGHGGLIHSWGRLNMLYAPHRIKVAELIEPPLMDPRAKTSFYRLRARRSSAGVV